jgi:DNA-binding IclR family transcriptional regulator
VQIKQLSACATPQTAERRARATLQTADRALQILLEFHGGGETLTVSGLASSLRLNRSTVSRLVTTLEARGFVRRVAGEGVQLGPEAARLGQLALQRPDLTAVARPVMDRLAQETGETVTLAVAAGGEALTVAEQTGSHFVSSRDWTGARTPGHCTSDGKVLIAFGAIPFPAGPLVALTPSTITTPEALRAELEVVRRQGFAVARGELERCLHGIAVPILEGDACAGALCVSGPEYRLHGAFERALAPMLKAAAADVSKTLSGHRDLAADDAG